MTEKEKAILDIATKGPWTIESYVAWFSQFRDIKEETSDDITIKIADLNIKYAERIYGKAAPK